MKTKTFSRDFKPYLISNLTYSRNSNLDDLIFDLLGIDRNSSKQEIMINQDELIYIIYGITATKISGYDTTSSVIDTIDLLHKYYLKQKNYNMERACNFFRYHFLNAIETNEVYLKNINIFSSSTFLINKAMNQLDNMNSKNRKSLVHTITEDIRFLNIYAFLHLETPISTVNMMTDICNNLMKYIKKDLMSTLVNPKLTTMKFHAYLDIAKKLLEKKPIVDFHGAGSIFFALSVFAEAINDASIKIASSQYQQWLKLQTLFSLDHNFKNLREKMNLYSIPALWIYSKDIHFSSENLDMYHHLEQKGKRYYELGEIKRNVYNAIPMKLNCTTDLIDLLGIDNSLKNLNLTNSIHSFFNKNLDTQQTVLIEKEPGETSETSPTF